MTFIWQTSLWPHFIFHDTNLFTKIQSYPQQRVTKDGDRFRISNEHFTLSNQHIMCIIYSFRMNWSNLYIFQCIIATDVWLHRLCSSYTFNFNHHKCMLILILKCLTHNHATISLNVLLQKNPEVIKLFNTSLSLWENLLNFPPLQNCDKILYDKIYICAVQTVLKHHFQVLWHPILNLHIFKVGFQSWLNA